ncbi:macro domain-containing protein [candidate division WOR-3 bacterium]|nr:macro domain-containing protein [candidate division WOR-3 bacterium]
MIKLIQGDITELDVDAIVNAANSHLQLGGGVAGAILRKGGQSIQDECDKIGFAPVGEAVITTGGHLKAKYIIHAVGPRMGEGNEDNKLLNATLNSLKIAQEHKLESIAFPAISTGIFGYPLDKCAKIMLKTTKEFLAKNNIPKEVIFCLYDDTAYQVFDIVKQELEKD